MMNVNLNRKDIELMVPHTGNMFLIDSVVDWNPNSIVCQGSCNNFNHPLRRNGVLPTTAAIEYAAQATAVHGCLLNGTRTSIPGFLAKLTNISLASDEIDNSENPLNIFAQLISRTEKGCIYKFEVRGTFHPIVSGQLMIAFPELVPS